MAAKKDKVLALLKKVTRNPVQISKRMTGFDPVAMSEEVYTLPPRSRFGKAEEIPMSALSVVVAGNHGPMGELKAGSGKLSAPCEALEDLANLMGLKPKSYSAAFAELIEGLRLAETSYASKPDAFREFAGLAADNLPADETKRFTVKS